MKKLACFVFVLFLCSFQVFAEENQSIVDEDSMSMEVNASISSSYIVNIPKSIKLSDIRHYQYEIGVDGSLAGDEVLVVKPVSDTFEMTSVYENGDTVSKYCEVSQDIIKFRDNDYTGALNDDELFMNSGTQGSIDLSNLTVGHWEGVISFSISIEKDTTI